MTSTLTDPGATPTSASSDDMSATAQRGGPPGGRGRRLALRGAALAGVVAAVAAAAVGLRAPSPPEVVATGVVPAFGAGTEVETTDWGSRDVFGVEGSHILAYRHGTDVTVRLPWDRGDVRSARLGDGDLHLLTVTEVEQHDGELVLTVRRDNCRYFHERAIDMFPHVTLGLTDGSDVRVVFDRPVFVKSPMLASCPDRTLDRQDDVRDATRRG